MIGKLREPRKRSSRLRIDKPGAIPYRFLHYRYLSGRNSAVECQLPKLDVAGSIPVARSKILLLNSLLLKAIFLGFGPKAEKCPKRAHGETAMLTVCEWRWTRRAPTGTAKKGAR